MKKIVSMLCLVLPTLVWAQLETVVQPQAIPVSNYTANTVDVNQALVNQNVPRQLPQGNLNITTGYGTATIERAQEQPTQQSETSLDDVVAQINADFEVAQESCTTGSWLGNIWCRVGGWF